MWILGAVLGVFIGASAATARYRGQMGIYLGSVIAAVIVVWLLSARIPGATGLIFVITYILTYGVLQFGVLRGRTPQANTPPGRGPGQPGQNHRIIDHKD